MKNPLELYYQFLHRFYDKDDKPEESSSLVKCSDNISKSFCNGSGYWSKSANKICFRCLGKGKQDLDDVLRNRWYDFLNRKSVEQKMLAAVKMICDAKREDLVHAYALQMYLSQELQLNLTVISEEEFLEFSKN